MAEQHLRRSPSASGQRKRPFSELGHFKIPKSDAARKGFEAAGVTMKDFYMVTRQYDMIAVVDAAQPKRF